LEQSELLSVVAISASTLSGRGSIAMPWRRVAAFAIDWCIILAVYTVIFVLPVVLGPHHDSKSHPPPPLHWWGWMFGIIFGTLAALIPAFFYFAACNGSRRGQTVGKGAMHIAVRDAQTGGKIGFWRAAGRYAILGLLALPLYVPLLLDGVAGLRDSQRRSWHDRVAHTVVADALLNSPPAAWYPDPSGEHHGRYWDGQNWTPFTHDLAPMEHVRGTE
jgi:uncharacterized RDD family membrane protein YckC